MSTRNAVIGAVVLVVALLALFMWRGAGTPEAPTRSEPRSSKAPSVEETAPASAAREPAPGETEPALSEDETPQPGEVLMPVEAKLVAEPLSEVPHEVLGAWDDQPDSPRLGAHRAFVAVVDPSISDSELEALLWDVRQRHRDAEVLDVRIYDSAQAARRPSYLDGGELRERHLVAEIKRNDRLVFESIEIRGTPIER